MTTAYRIAPAPRLAGMRSWDCQVCHAEELKAPVFLTGPDGLIAAGTGCAANLLGYTRPNAGRLVRREFDAANHAETARRELAAERQAAYTAAAEAFAAHNDTAPELERARRTYHTLGGSVALGSFSAWLAAVAATGDLA